MHTLISCVLIRIGKGENAMTVGELREKLENIPVDYDVTFYTCTVGDTVNLISVNDLERDDTFGLVQLKN